MLPPLKFWCSKAFRNTVSTDSLCKQLTDHAPIGGVLCQWTRTTEKGEADISLLLLKEVEDGLFENDSPIVIYVSDAEDIASKIEAIGFNFSMIIIEVSALKTLYKAHPDKFETVLKKAPIRVLETDFRDTGIVGIFDELNQFDEILTSSEVDVVDCVKRIRAREEALFRVPAKQNTYTLSLREAFVIFKKRFHITQQDSRDLSGINSYFSAVDQMRFRTDLKRFWLEIPDCMKFEDNGRVLSYFWFLPFFKERGSLSDKSIFSDLSGVLNQLFWKYFRCGLSIYFIDLFEKLDPFPVIQKNGFQIERESDFNFPFFSLSEWILNQHSEEVLTRLTQWCQRQQSDEFADFISITSRWERDKTQSILDRLKSYPGAMKHSGALVLFFYSRDALSCIDGFNVSGLVSEDDQHRLIFRFAANKDFDALTWFVENSGESTDCNKLIRVFLNVSLNHYSKWDYHPSADDENSDFLNNALFWARRLADSFDIQNRIQILNGETVSKAPITCNPQPCSFLLDRFHRFFSGQEFFVSEKSSHQSLPTALPSSYILLDLVLRAGKNDDISLKQIENNRALYECLRDSDEYTNLVILCVFEYLIACMSDIELTKSWERYLHYFEFPQSRIKEKTLGLPKLLIPNPLITGHLKRAICQVIPLPSL